MAFYAGQKVHTADLSVGVVRCYSTGVNLTSVAASGTGLCTFDTVQSAGVGDISVSGTNNTRYTFNVTGEYRYGWCVRYTHSSTPSSNTGDVVVYARLNGTSRLATRITKCVLSSPVFYVVSAADTRSFNATDYIEIALANNLSVTVAESSAFEITHVWAKRIIGP